MASRILLRGDTAANWASANPVLAAREEGLETDTHRRKVGDGATAWNSLPYSVVVPVDLGAAVAADPTVRAAYVTTVGTGAAPVTDIATARPSTTGVVYWLCANGIAPTNALPGDLIWNASA